MSQKSRISGAEYSFLERVPSLDGEKSYVLCEGTGGKRFVCPEELWLAHVPCSAKAAPVTTHSSVQEKIDCFLTMFRGREGLYARRYYSAKTGKSGYTPVCKNEWVPGLCDKRTHKCSDCPNRAFVPLTFEAVRAHLRGSDPLCRDVAAIYPMREDNTTWLLAADFDEANWQADVSAFCACCTSRRMTVCFPHRTLFPRADSAISSPCRFRDRRRKQETPSLWTRRLPPIPTSGPISPRCPKFSRSSWPSY